MRCSNLAKLGVSTPETQAYLADSKVATVTFRLLRAMRDSAKGYAALNDLSFTLLMNRYLIEKLTKKG